MWSFLMSRKRVKTSDTGEHTLVMPSTLSRVLLGRRGMGMWLRGSEAPVAIEILQKYKAPHAFRLRWGGTDAAAA